MAEERPFSVAVLFGVVWVVLAYLAGVLVLPVWSYLNIGLCSLAVLLCVMNYVNEYLGKFPLDYRYEVKMKIGDQSFITSQGAGGGGRGGRRGFSEKCGVSRKLITTYENCTHPHLGNNKFLSCTLPRSNPF